MALRIIIFEDNDSLRESLVFLLKNTGDYEVAGDYNNCIDASNITRMYKPDVVLMDIFLPRMSGIECTVRLKALLPQTQIIILTAMDDQELVFLALEAGADGYLLKRTKPADLRAALLDVLSGGAPMSSEIARRVVLHFRQKAKPRDESTKLSNREHEVLVLLAKGYDVVDSLAVPLLRQHPGVAMQLMLMDAESFAISTLITNTMFNTVGRTRPSYEDCQRNPSFDPLCRSGDTTSFPSGHTNGAFTAAGLSS